MNNNCIFCKIIAGEIPSTVVYEDDDFKAIMDISPAAKGHVILLSKKHFENIYEIDDDTALKAFGVVRKVAAAIKEELHCDGVNILQNNGEAAGQTVFHFHIHIIPRYHKDQVTMEWVHQTYADGEAAVFATAIKSRIS